MNQFRACLLTAAAALAGAASHLAAQPPAPTADAGNCPPTGKVCVREAKPTVKTVYACKREEYCLPRCPVLPLLFGKCDCDGRCELRARNRLVVRRVEGPEVKQCVLREVPSESAPARKSAR